MDRKIASQLSSRMGRVGHLVAAHLRALSRQHRSPTRPVRAAVICDAFIRYGSAQALGLQAAGAHVTFYYIDRLGEFAGSLADREEFLNAVRDSGIEVVELPQRNMRRFIRQTLQLHKDLVARNVQVVVVQQHIDPRYATLGLRFRTALVLHDPQTHGGDYASTYPGPVRAIARFAEVTASVLLLHSSRLVPQLRPLLKSLPTATIPHGAAVLNEPCGLPSRPTVVLAGRLMEYKGIYVALAAFEIVVQNRPDATLVIAGRGRIGDEIRARALPNVRLYDRYMREGEMRAVLDEATIVILPYLDATQSGVGLSAIARGIPCVVSDVGALPDLVPPHRPWVVPPRDAQALAAGILEALDHDEATRVEVLQFARDNFAWPLVGRKLLRELDLLDGGKIVLN
jgi:glycosyltransferase involved in cell wall biosynthesis